MKPNQILQLRSLAKALLVLLSSLDLVPCIIEECYLDMFYPKTGSVVARPLTCPLLIFHTRTVQQLSQLKLHLLFCLDMQCTGGG